MKNKMSFTREILTRTAWWAPVAVLILHKLVMWAGLRGQSDWLLHFTGGLAISFFIWTLVPLLDRWFGVSSLSWRMVITFLSGCTVALIWDLSEFASDEILGTDIQHSLRETMLDLANSIFGVTATTITVVVFRRGAMRRQ